MVAHAIRRKGNRIPPGGNAPWLTYSATLPATAGNWGDGALAAKENDKRVGQKFNAVPLVNERRDRKQR